jgi:PIN domain nuclease of toxin-antitoxin system
MDRHPSLLLDTCALIWTVEDQLMSVPAQDAINRANAGGHPIYVSPISAWERGMLVAKGRMSSPLPPVAWFERVVSRPELALAALTPAILTEASFLPGQLHNDPADRIIIATARALDLTIVTRDRAILRYGDQGHVRALAC